MVSYPSHTVHGRTVYFVLVWPVLVHLVPSYQFRRLVATPSSCHLAFGFAMAKIWFPHDAAELISLYRATIRSKKSAVKPLVFDLISN